VRIRSNGQQGFFNYYTNLETNQYAQDFLYSATPSGYDIYSARLDYTRMLHKKYKMELGGRGSRVVSDNDFKFYFNNGSLVDDPSRSNHFLYSENIYAGYVNFNGPLSKTLTLQAGLRAERTQSTGNLLTTGQVNTRDYTKLFPSVFLQHKVSKDYGISYSYSRRLTRPNYGNLNPFRSYRDPYTYSEGNPGLRPQYTHLFTINQSYKSIYSLSLNVQRNRDVMSEVPILDVSNNITIYTTGNLDQSYSVGATAVAPLKIAKWWDSQNTSILSYSELSSLSNNGLLENKQLFFMFQSNHTMRLPKEMRIELNMLYRGPAANGLYHMAGMSRIDVAVKKSFLNKKLELSMNANDLFKGYRYLWTTNINGNVNDFDQYFRWRSVGASLRYNFSKGQKVDSKKRTAVEELNRT
jgi:hypothetical protein